MSFNDRPLPFVAPDKMLSMDKLAKSVISFHQKIDDYIDDLNTATIGITEFLTKDLGNEAENLRKIQSMTEEQLKKYIMEKKMDLTINIISAYESKNQTEFEKYLTVIEQASGAIYPVIVNIQKEFAISLKGQPQMETPNTGNYTKIEMPSLQPQRNWLKNPFKKEPKAVENVTYLTAYSKSIDMIDELQQIPVIISKYKSYHWQRFSDCIGLLYGKTDSQILLLLMEIQYYHDMVKPRINNVVSEAMRINLESEKVHIDSILGRAQSVHERRDFQPQIPQPQK